jgi:chaperone modulatory protein CbpM
VRRDYEIRVELLDEQTEYTLREVTRICDVPADQIVELIAEGICSPRGEQPPEWRFSGTTVVRMQTALRLQRDLGLNHAGAALVLELLDDLTELRRRLRRHEGE